MKLTLSFAAALLLAAPAFAQAQTAVGVGIAGSASQSGAVSVSRSTQSSRNSASINVAAPPASTYASNRVSGTQRLIAAPAVFAPGLAAASIETCLGSASGGVSFPGGGVSFGSTTVDHACQTRLDARTLFAFGLKGAAIARLCASPEIAAVLPQCQPPQAALTTGSIAPASYTAQAVEPRRGCQRYELFRGCLD